MGVMNRLVPLRQFTKQRTYVGSRGPARSHNRNDVRNDDPRDSAQALAPTILASRKGASHHDSPDKAGEVRGDDSFEQGIVRPGPPEPDRLCYPHASADDEQQIACKQYNGRQGSLAVPQPHPAFADPAAPAETIPALESDAMDPARLLSHSLAEPRRKTSSSRDEMTIIASHSQKARASACGLHAQAEFIVLGQRLHRERAATTPGHHFAEHRPRHPASDSGRGHCRRKRLSDQ